MAEKSIIIIGAGIAGLSAGCYGQMNGYRTHIFEMHSLPGGLCTAWKRRGRSSSVGQTVADGTEHRADLVISRARLWAGVTLLRR